MWKTRVRTTMNHDMVTLQVPVLDLLLLYFHYVL